MKIKVYTAEHCAPCQDLKEPLERPLEGVEVFDIETDDGYKAFYEEILKNKGGSVPSAFMGDKECRIAVGEDNALYIRCPVDESEPYEEEEGTILVADDDGQLFLERTITAPPASAAD